jgi:uncharacterized protein YraI
MLLRIIFGIILIILSACQNSPQLTVLPTLAVLPTAAPLPVVNTVSRAINLPVTWTPTDTSTPLPTDTPTATVTGTLPPTATPTITLTPSITFTPTPMGNARVIGENGVNLRSGPSTRFTPALALLEHHTELMLVGRTNDLLWYEIQTFDGRVGWVYSDLIEVRIDPTVLTVRWIDTPTPPPVVVVDVTEVDGAPPVDGKISQRAIQIYRQGIQRGNSPNVFSKVGDSITANQPFLRVFYNHKYDLASYAYLQPTIDYYYESFGRKSLAASSAFNAAAVLSSIWADTSVCQPNETPLDCEYRVNRPSIAIIMLGSVDMQLYSAAEFEGYMNTIVQSTISQGIIPVLTTFPNRQDFHWYESVEFNDIIRRIAGREQIPLIELRDPALALPDNGVKEDKYHLTEKDSDQIVFNSDEYQWGLPLRDMLTLQMLDTIRRSVG